MNLLLAALLLTATTASPNDAVIIDSHVDQTAEPIGNVLVIFTDGHREKWTRHGGCLMPHVSDSGLVGWARIKMRFEDGEPLSPMIRICQPDGHFKDIGRYESDSYLDAWCFAENDTAVVIESSPGRHQHGPSHFTEYNLRTGGIMTTADGDRPPWARGLSNP